MQTQQVYCAAAFIAAIGTAIWITNSRAQEAASASSASSDARPAPSGAASSGSSSAPTENRWENAGGGPRYYEYGSLPSAQADPLQDADRNHAQETHDLVAKYHGAADSERDEIRQALNQVLVKHFDVRQQMRTRELEELEDQVLRLRDLHDRRQQEKDQIIRDRLNQILRDADGLGWGPGDAPQSSGAWYWSQGNQFLRSSRYSAGSESAPRSVAPSTDVPARAVIGR